MPATGTGSITVLFSTRELPGDQREPRANGRSGPPQHEVGALAQTRWSEGRRSAAVRLPRDPGAAEWSSQPEVFFRARATLGARANVLDRQLRHHEPVGVETIPATIARVSPPRQEWPPGTAGMKPRSGTAGSDCRRDCGARTDCINHGPEKTWAEFCPRCNRRLHFISWTIVSVHRSHHDTALTPVPKPARPCQPRDAGAYSVRLPSCRAE
jgi:hypothetical protein